VKLLLDTAAFLWIAGGGHAKLSRPSREAIGDIENQLYLSAASVWEICVKYRRGRLPLPSPPEQIIANESRRRGIESLAFSEAAALRVSQLPDIHADPFDRMLICQAIEHAMTIVTPDAIVRSYPIRTIW
jgi:PIN domain nuclease of toxin-antitoxin system